MRYYKLVLILAIVFSCATVHAHEFFENHSEGWFWYQDPEPEEIKTEKEDRPEVPKTVETRSRPKKDIQENIQKKESKENNKPTERVNVFSVQWINKNLPKFRDRAIDNPTEENVKAFLRIQKIMLWKSQQFADASTAVVQQNPMLDGNTIRSGATFAARMQIQKGRENEAALLNTIAQRAGIFCFFKEKTELIEKQAYILKQLSKTYGLKIYLVSSIGQNEGDELHGIKILKDIGQSKSLKIINYPSMFLAVPSMKKIVPIAQNGMGMQELTKRILVASKIAGLISNKEYQQTKGVNQNLVPALTEYKIPAGVEITAKEFNKITDKFLE